MSPAASGPSVQLEQRLPRAPEVVWRALTESALIAQWLMKNDFQPTVGHRFTLRATPLPYWNGVANCQVLLVEPPQRLIYSWNASDKEAARGPRTVVTITLTPVDAAAAATVAAAGAGDAAGTASAGGTRLWVEQAGFRVEEGGRYQDARIHWQRFLERLAAVVVGL